MSAPSKPFNLAQFVWDRDDALLSLDEEKIRAYAKKYQVRFPSTDDPEVFWLAVHKAIAYIPTLPEEAREASKKWLAEHDSKTLEDA